MGRIIGALLMFAAVIAVFFGWGLNLSAVITAAQADAGFTLRLALRIVGVFVFPLGALFGWML